MASETILGLDLGTKCGYAVITGKRLVVSGQWKLAVRKGGDRGDRWTTFSEDLTHHVRAYKPQVIAYERVRRHVGTTAAHVYGGFLAMLELAALKMPNVEWVPIEVSAWKKATTGKGNATKSDVRAYVDKLYRINTRSEDEADAIAIATAVRTMRSKP